MKPAEHPDNPYTPPSAEPLRAPRRFRFLAVLAGWVTDVACTVGGTLVLGLVVGMALGARGIPAERVDAILDCAPWFDALGQLVGSMSTCLGGYVAARMAKGFPLRHAFAVGMASLLTGLVPTVLVPDAQPLWTSVAGLVVAIPAALLGGAMSAARAVSEA